MRIVTRTVTHEMTRLDDSAQWADAPVHGPERGVVWSAESLGKLTGRLGPSFHLGTCELYTLALDRLHRFPGQLARLCIPSTQPQQSHAIFARHTCHLMCTRDEIASGLRGRPGNVVDQLVAYFSTTFRTQAFPVDTNPAVFCVAPLPAFDSLCSTLLASLAGARDKMRRVCN